MNILFYGLVLLLGIYGLVLTGAGIYAAMQIWETWMVIVALLIGFGLASMIHIMAHYLSNQED